MNDRMSAFVGFFDPQDTVAEKMINRIVFASERYVSSVQMIRLPDIVVLAVNGVNEILVVQPGGISDMYSYYLGQDRGIAYAAGCMPLHP